jgi:hypothetical protein
MVDTIGTNDVILDIPTIDAACGNVERVCYKVQIIEDFAYQQPPTALTDHVSSFCASVRI